MEILFYIASIVAVVSTIMVITRLNAVHALLYLVVSLLAVALIFFIIGAPFIAVLEVIIYAGAIMVLFLFVVMMLNLGKIAVEQERRWLSPGIWIGPAILSLILLLELIFMFAHSSQAIQATMISPKEVGVTLFGPYLLGVELAAMLLLASIVGAYHLSKRKKKAKHRFMEETAE
ncbi:MAG: NADH-quinone oxidoreductase subunit J [Caldithrix sp.]|nr:NADH-quinone oxidoreductase subunit J [Caldithrix sp.]